MSQLWRSIFICISLDFIILDCKVDICAFLLFFIYQAESFYLTPQLPIYILYTSIIRSSLVQYRPAYIYAYLSYVTYASTA
jgi:hypothetical protein